MSTLNKSSIDILSDIGLRQEKEEALFQKNCPHCYSEKVKIHSHYQTKGTGNVKCSFVKNVVLVLLRLMVA